MWIKLNVNISKAANNIFKTSNVILEKNEAPLNQWFSTLEPWQPTKGYCKNFGGPPHTSLIVFVSFRPLIELKLT